MRVRSRTPWAAAAVCLSLAAYGQVELPRLTEVVEVRVTNIDVVVTDERGARVHGLTKDDFAVYDGDTAQEITNFSEFAAAASRRSAPAMPATSASTAVGDDVPPRHIVIFFDNLSTNTQDRKRVATALAELIRDLRPVDDAMIVSWNRSLSIVVPPTSDRAALEAGLSKAAREISLRGAAMFGTGQRIDPAEQRIMARRQKHEAFADQSASVAALNAILSRLAGLDGRKALILISTGFSFRPGGEETPDVDDDQLWELENVPAPELLRSLTTTANAIGIPIYSMHTGGLQSGMSAGDAAPGMMMGRIRAIGKSIDGLTYLSARTGGLVAANTAGFRTAVARISEDLSTYYSIGYRSTVTRNDRDRRIRVVTRDDRYAVRARSSAVARSFESELSNRVIAALLFKPDHNQLNISASIVGNERKKRNELSLPVDVQIPLAGLTFTSEGGGSALAADVSIFIASADKSGSISEVEQFRQRIPVKREQLRSLAAMHYTYGLNVGLKTNSSENRLAIAVLDNIARTTGIVTVDVTPPR